MHQFSVSDMTCGHCVSAVTKAVKSVDAQAKVEASLGDKRVVVHSTLSQQEIAEAIQEAGYTPRLES
jgi:copper chaperone